MKPNTIRIFSDIDKLQKMLHERRTGSSYNELARIYGCHPRSIAGQCVKYGVKPLVPIKPESGRLSRIFSFDKTYSTEKINPGKLCYADYLEAERSRKEKTGKV